MLLLRRVLVQVQQRSIIRRCIGLMRCRVLGASLAGWRQWAVSQRSMTEGVQQAEVKRHAKLKVAVLRRWASVAVLEAAQRRKLLLVVGTMRASALARWAFCQGRNLLSNANDRTCADAVSTNHDAHLLTASCLRLLRLNVCCVSKHNSCHVAARVQVVPRVGGSSSDVPPPLPGAGLRRGPPHPPDRSRSLRYLGELGANVAVSLPHLQPHLPAAACYTALCASRQLDPDDFDKSTVGYTVTVLVQFTGLVPPLEARHGSEGRAASGNGAASTLLCVLAADMHQQPAATAAALHSRGHPAAPTAGYLT